MALAIALAAGAVLGVAALETPAHAQEEEEEEKETVEKEYSEEFRAVYEPVAEMANAEAPDIAVLKTKVPEVAAAVQTADDRMAAGSLIYSIGQKAGDLAVQLQGVEMMLASGKVAQENLGQYNFSAGQLAYQLDDFATARSHVQKAIDLGYTQNDPAIIIAESYFSEENYAAGLAYLTETIEARKAADETVKEEWIRRGLAMAYNNKLDDQASKYALWYIQDYPSDESWGDAIAIILNTSTFKPPETLDLLRLARRTDTFRGANMYLEYIDAADYRRLPGEVVAIIDEGYASGMLDRSDTTLAQIRSEASERAATDKAGLPGLLADARASGADLKTVTIAGDVHLSYGEGAAAEDLYIKALAMPGVDTPQVLTRLGIAQFYQGKFVEAAATFDRVEGPREKIADLWSIYAKQQAG